MPQSRDYGLFLPAQSKYDPEEYEAAMGQAASQQASYESQMDQYYTGLAAQLGMFNEELEFKRDVHENEFGLAERKWDEGLEFEKSKWEDEFGLQEDIFGFEKEKWADEFSLQEDIFGFEKEKFGKEFGLQEDIFGFEKERFGKEFGLKEDAFEFDQTKWGEQMDFQQQELDQAAMLEILPYAYAEDQQYQAELKKWEDIDRKFGSGVAASYNWTAHQNHLRNKPKAPSNSFNADDLYSKYL